MNIVRHVLQSDIDKINAYVLLLEKQATSIERPVLVNQNLFFEERKHDYRIPTTKL